MLKYYVLYLVIMNVLDFVLMWRDKRKAQRRQWRIPEAVLLGVGALGGCFGGFAAMHLFRHKTLHMTFKMGFPVMMLVHVILFIRFLETGTLIPLP